MSRANDVTVFDPYVPTLDDESPTLRFERQAPGHLDIGTVDDAWYRNPVIQAGIVSFGAVAIVLALVYLGIHQG
jgi:hypothetical protein